MPLESLLKLAETLKERVDVHRAALGASETLTRYALIDPLLRELGWDTSDPSAVIPEYKTRQGGIADYALLKADSPAVMVEAKKLGTPLRDDVLSQGITYCMMEGTEHFSVTNGARWEIYETHKPVPIDQKLVAEFDLSEDSPASFCLKALALWRPRYAIQGDWHRFTDIEYAPGRKPVELMFPDNTRTALNGWFSLLVETTRWLSSNGYLTKAHCPITLKGPGAKRYIVHTQPIHSDGKGFTNPSEVNGFYVDKHNQVKHHFGRAMAVIKRVGQDPSQFRVRFA